MNVYFISGLAADERVFKNIRLPDHCKAVHLNWIAPQKNESLRSYALRMAVGIDKTTPFALVGLSMGGMMITEIACAYNPVATILISSIPFSRQLPYYYKFAGACRLHKVLPISLVKSAAFVKRYFTPESDEDKDVLRNVIRDSDDHFISWAMDAIVKWKNEEAPPSYIHIHGSRDEVLPLRYTKPTHLIPKAGHLMVMNRAAEINLILAQTLKAAACS
jgi:pimeloyl-ACP methyl ester carboxylesterase